MLHEDEHSNNESANVPAEVEKSGVTVLQDVQSPTVTSQESVPAEHPDITRIDDVFTDDHLGGGYATVKGTRKSDNKLLWMVIIVMTVICCAVGVCSAVLTGYFMRRGAAPVKIDPTYKYEAISAVVEARKPCIVEIESGSAHGSGVIMKLENSKIYILTNYHVIENGYIKVRFMGADSWYDQVDVVGYDVGFDVAVVTIASSTAPYEIYELDGSDSFSRTLSYKEGDIVVAIGNAMGHGIAAYDGIISRASELITKNNDKAVPVLRTTAAINAGMSGGGLFDTEGRFVGLSTYRMANYMPGSSSSDYDVEDTGYVVPVSIVYPLYKQIVQFGNGGSLDNLISLSFSNTKLSAGSKTSVGSVNFFCVGFGGFTAEYRNGGKLTVVALDSGTPARGMQTLDVIKSVGVNVTADICALCGELLRYRYKSYTGSALVLGLSRDGNNVSVTVDDYYRFVD